MVTSSIISELFLLSVIHRCQSVTFQTITDHSLPFPWSSGISFVYDDKLTLLGGTNLLNEIYTLDLSSIQLTENDTKILPSSFNQNTWQQHDTTYPSFTCCSSTSDYSSLGITSLSQQWTVLGDRVYIAAPDDYTLSDFLIFDMTQSQFMDPTSYNSEGAASNVGVSCVTNNYTHFFVLGGQTNSYETQFNTNRIYNIRTDSWSEGASMLTTRAHFACQHNFARDTFYIFGGFDYNSMTSFRRDSIERYDIESDSWTDLDPVTLSSTANRLRCILDEVNHDSIYCIAGYDGVVLDTVDVFDTTSETITTSNNALSFPNDVSGVAFYTVNGNGIVFNIGGGTNSATDLDVIQYTIISAPQGVTTSPTMKPSLFPTTTHAPTLDASAYQFTEFAPNVFSLPVASQQHLAYIYDDKLNIFGGITTGTDPILNIRYELDLSSIDFESAFPHNESSELNETLLDIQTKWTTVPLPFPTDKYAFTNYSANGILCTATCYTIIQPLMYIINGQSLYENQNMIVYDMNSGSFISKSTYNWTLTTHIIAPCVTNDGLHIFVIGGYDFIMTVKTFTRQTQIYTIADDDWTLGSEFSIARAFHSCAINADKTDIFIFGGYDGSIRFESIEQYNIENDVWTLLSTATLSSDLSIINACILDDITQYTDQILCIGGSDSQKVRTMNIFDPNTNDIQIVRDSLAVPVTDSARALYNIPNSNRHLLFIFGGESNAASYIDKIQYLTLIEPPPTPEPTAYPTIPPTRNPSANPTVSPSDNPTINPTKYPSDSPTLSPTSSIYNIYWIQTNVEEETMIQPVYKQSAINAIESVVHNEEYNSYSLTYISTLVCEQQTDEFNIGWQYEAGMSASDMDSIAVLLDDVIIKSDITNELEHIAENDGYDIVLVEVEFSDTIITQCEGDEDEDKHALGNEQSNFGNMGYFVLGSMIVLLLLLVIASCAMHSTKSFRGSDSPDYLSLFRYCANLGDFWSDIIFMLHLNVVGSSLFIWAFVFTLVPYTLSIILLIAFIYIVKTSKADSTYVGIAKYLHKYDYILIGLSLIGGLFPSLSIVSSKLFHLQVFSMNLRYDHTSRMQIVRFFNISFLENLPQLVIQIMFVGKSGLTDSITVISMFFSILSLLMGVIQTISTSLGRRTANKQTRDVTRKISHWLHSDTILGDETDGLRTEEEEQNRKTTVSNIKNYPKMLFDVKIGCNHFTKHHRFTQYLMTQLISEHIQMDESCLELFGFTMNSTHNELQFYVEISLIKLMRFEADLDKVKFSRVKNRMLLLTQRNQEDDFGLKLMKKLKIKTSIQEISITCDYKENGQMISLSSAH